MLNFEYLFPRLGLFGRSKFKDRAVASGRSPVKDRAVASGRSPVKAGDLNRKGYARGVKKERARCRAIIESPEARGRYAAAVSLASTDIPANLCRQYLREMPRKGDLAEIMSSVPNPDVGPGWGDDAGDPTTEQVARRIINAPRVEVCSKPSVGQGPGAVSSSD